MLQVTEDWVGWVRYENKVRTAAGLSQTGETTVGYTQQVTFKSSDSIYSPSSIVFDFCVCLNFCFLWFINLFLTL